MNTKNEIINEFHIECCWGRSMEEEEEGGGGGLW